MRPPEVVGRETAAEFTSKAEDDLAAARGMMEKGLVYPWIICFHAQQAAEKYVKAYLTIHGVEFPKTHDIGLLLKHVRSLDPTLAGLMADAVRLSPYAARIRYVAATPEVSVEQARKATDIALAVRSALSSHLGLKEQGNGRAERTP
jgi:HEPN domain-containing protein